MLSLPGGTFQMGGIPTGTERHNIQPVHAVTVGAFAIGQYEITRGEYAAFVRDSGRPAAGGAGTAKRSQAGCVGAAVGGRSTAS